MSSASRLRVSAALSAVLFVIGYLVVVVVPGGGQVTESDFTEFYDSDGKLALEFLLTVGFFLAAAALAWHFIELRTSVGGSVLAQLAATLGTMGAVALPVGAAILLAPAGVQLNSDAGFVGVPIAHAFAQAGLGVMMLLGMGLLGVSTILFALEIRRTKAGPSWLWMAGGAAGVIAFGSYIWVPGLAFPVWLIVLAAAGLRSNPVAANAPVAAASRA